MTLRTRLRTRYGRQPADTFSGHIAYSPRSRYEDTPPGHVRTHATVQVRTVVPPYKGDTSTGPAREFIIEAIPRNWPGAQLFLSMRFDPRSWHPPLTFTAETPLEARIDAREKTPWPVDISLTRPADSRPDLPLCRAYLTKRQVVR